MADSRARGTSVMDLRVIALYPGRIAALSGRSGVRFRSRRDKHACTVVPCHVDTIDGRSVAAPEYPIPEGTPLPKYRMQLETLRVSVEERRVTYVALSAEPESSKTDPEQILLSPIFDDGYRLIFEFTRAHILSLDRRGDLETRLVAVHPVLGVVGTKTIYRFNVRLSALAARCMEHLAGAVDLFPPREHSPRASRGQIPVGEANLSFDSKVPSARRPRDEIESSEGLSAGRSGGRLCT